MAGAVAFVMGRAVAAAYPRAPRRWIVLTLLCAIVAFTPIPIHGGFLFLLPELVSEGRRELGRQRSVAQQEEERARLDRRFVGYLPEEAVRAHWRDTSTGLVWTDQVGRVAPYGPESLAQGRALCGAVAPAGYWAVPRNAEFYYLARAGRLTGGWIADAFVMPGEISIPSLVGHPGRRSPGAEIPLRCVAITPPAPRGGYVSTDIPLEDWNRYQLGQ